MIIGVSALELLVCAIQAYVFALLTSLYLNDAVHLHGPLGLALAPNGDLVSTQSDAINQDPNQLSEVVEFTPAGKFVAEFQVDPNAGSAFGLAIRSRGDGFVFATVDDTTAVLDIWDVAK